LRKIVAQLRVVADFFTATAHNYDTVIAVFRNCVAVNADFLVSVTRCGDCVADARSYAQLRRRLIAARNCGVVAKK
jgi:hypothetical protein